MGQVDGKIALVTGGASGIGEACVQTLAREGAAVVISDIDDVRGNDLASAITSVGQQAIYLRHDVTTFTLEATAAGVRLYEQVGFKTVGQPAVFVIGNSTQFST